MIRAVMAYLGGRGRRLEYWLAVFAILAVMLTLPDLPLPGGAVDLAGLVVWCVFAARRLRDAGLPFWLAPFPLPIALVSIKAREMLMARVGGALQATLAQGWVNIGSALVLFGLIGVLGCLPSRTLRPTPDDRAEVFG